MPPPFVYHPELFPELAKNNPQPSNFEIPKKKSKLNRSPNKLKAKVVEVPSRVEVKTMSPDLA
jgi:hypothetical protein